MIISDVTCSKLILKYSFKILFTHIDLSVLVNANSLLFIASAKNIDIILSFLFSFTIYLLSKNYFCWALCSIYIQNLAASHDLHQYHHFQNIICHLDYCNSLLTGFLISSCLFILCSNQNSQKNTLKI